jgi:hypothetical protein
MGPILAALDARLTVSAVGRAFFFSTFVTKRRDATCTEGRCLLVREPASGSGRGRGWVSFGYHVHTKFFLKNPQAQAPICCLKEYRDARPGYTLVQTFRDQAIVLRARTH